MVPEDVEGFGAFWRRWYAMCKTRGVPAGSRQDAARKWGAAELDSGGLSRTRLSADDRVGVMATLDGWEAYYTSAGAQIPPHGVRWLNSGQWSDPAPTVLTPARPTGAEHAGEWNHIAVIVRRHGLDVAVGELRRLRVDTAWLDGYHARYPDPLYAIPADRVVPGATVTA